MKLSSSLLMIFFVLYSSTYADSNKKSSTHDAQQSDKSTLTRCCTGIVRLPFVLGKNITAGTTIMGLGITAICAYLWLVKQVNTGVFNTVNMQLQQKTLTVSAMLSETGTFDEQAKILRAQGQWYMNEFYKNIDLATIGSGIATTISAALYLIFKSVADVL